MYATILDFNACKNAIGHLLRKFDKTLTENQKKTLLRAWTDWTLTDRVGRARARKLIHDTLGHKAQDVISQLDRFNKEHSK